MIVNSGCFSVVVFVYFPSLGYAGGRLSDVHIIVGAVSFLGLHFSSSTFCKAGFGDTYCLNLLLPWNILFSPSMVNESFAGYSSLGLHLVS